jgi:hypothetical protein
MTNRPEAQSRSLIVIGYVVVAIGFGIQFVRLAYDNPPSNFRMYESLAYYGSVPIA